jgi:hypothetical protein
MTKPATKGYILTGSSARYFIPSGFTFTITHYEFHHMRNR